MKVVICMKGLIIGSSTMNTLNLIKTKLKDVNDIEFVIKNNLNLKELENYSVIAIEWSFKEKIKKYLYNLKGKKVYFFLNDIFVDIEDKEKIKLLEKSFLENEQWQFCKAINEIKLYANIINENTYLDSYPMRLQIETTDLCNAKCIMCSHAYNTGTGLNPLKQGITKKLKNVLPYVRNIIIHGNGEPFINKNIVEYLNEFLKYEIRFVSNTNLSIVNEDLIELWNKSFDELNISCDGCTKDVYEKIRVGLDFEQFFSNVKLVRKRCPKLNLRMMVVLMHQNMHQMKDMVQFADELGINQIIFNQLCVDEKNNNINDAAYLYPEELTKYTLEAVNEAKNRKISVIIPDEILKNENQTIKNVNIENDDFKLNCKGICDWAVSSPYIDLRGNVAICCIHQQKILGNLFEEDFDTIWNNKEYQNIRKTFYESCIPNMCRGCDFLLQDRLEFLNVKDIPYAYLVKEGRK